MRFDPKHPHGQIATRSNETHQETTLRDIFVAMGYVPETDLFSYLVKTTAEKRIMISENNQTNIPGLFAAGDITDVNAQRVVIIIGEGANAALSAYNYLLSLEP